MKRNYIGNLTLGLLLVLAVFACTSKQETAQGHEQHTYTCPMHPQVVKESPGSCPICGMDLVPMAVSGEVGVDTSLLPLLKPANEQVIANVPTIQAQSSIRILNVSVQGIVSYDIRKQLSVASRVAGRIEGMSVKYNFQPVRKGELLMEIYSPDLAAAQRELIYLSRNDPNSGLLQGARQKLLLLGMQPAQIERVIRTGEPLYRVPVYSPSSGYIVDKTSLPASAPQQTMPLTSSAQSSGMGMGGAAMEASAPRTPAMENSPVLIREGQYVSAGETVFTIYQASSLVADFYLSPSVAAAVKKGQKLVYSRVTSPEQASVGTIGLIEPTLREGESFTTARVYLSGSDLQPGQLLRANVPVVARQGWWLPQSAVVGLGNRSVLFRKENRVFVPKQVKTGLRDNGQVQILDNISGWQVARSASYLVDNESFIRASADL